MTTDWEDSHFGKEFLEDIKNWISENFDIDELYDPKYIKNWLEDNADGYGYVQKGDE